MLRVRTGPKALKAIGGSFFKLWDSKEKLTGPNTLLAVRKTIYSLDILLSQFGTSLVFHFWF